MNNDLNNLIDHLNKIYSFDSKVTLLDRVTKGFLSENHIIGNPTTKYFLKKYRFDDEQTIKTIHQVKFHFANNNIPVILPLKTTNQQTYFTFDGNFFAIFPFIKDLTIEDKKEWNTTAIKSLAENLALIHQAGKNHKITFPQNQNTFDKKEHIQKINNILNIIKNKLEKKDDFDKLALKVLRLKKKILKTIPSENFISKLKNDHLIHGDYQNQNIYFNHNYEVSHIFDWEKAALSPRIPEVLRVMEYVFMQNNFTKKDLQQALTFFKFYNQNYPLTKTEIETGLTEYTLKKISSLWVETEHYLKGNKRVDQFLLPQIKSIHFFTGNKDNLEKQIINNL